MLMNDNLEMFCQTMKHVDFEDFEGFFLLLALCVYSNLTYDSSM